MNRLLKRLVFPPLFLGSFIYLVFLTKPFLGSVDLLLSLNWISLKPLLVLSATALLTSLFFVVSVTLSQDWRIILINSLFSSAAAFYFFAAPLNLLLAAGFLISLLLTAAVLDKKLRTYLNFQAEELLSPPIRNLALFLVLVISVAYFFNLDAQIKRKGFELPDSLIDSTLNFYQTAAPDQQLAPKLTDQQKQQLQYLKSNPQLLKQSGYTLKDLQDLEQAANGTASTLPGSVRESLKNQLQNIIKPYLNFVAPLLAALAFLTLSSIVALLALALHPILWLLFLFLKAVNLIRFETEMRSVKKLVV